MFRIGGKCPLTFSCLTCYLINLLLSGSGQCEREAAQQQSLQHLESSQYIQLLKKIILLKYIYKIVSICILSDFFLLPIFAHEVPCVSLSVSSSVSPHSPGCTTKFVSLSIPALGLGNGSAEPGGGIQVVQRRV